MSQHYEACPGVVWRALDDGLVLLDSARGLYAGLGQRLQFDQAVDGVYAHDINGDAPATAVALPCPSSWNSSWCCHTSALS